MREKRSLLGVLALEDITNALLPEEFEWDLIPDGSHKEALRKLRVINEQMSEEGQSALYQLVALVARKLSDGEELGGHDGITTLANKQVVWERAGSSYDELKEVLKATMPNKYWDYSA